MIRPAIFLLLLSLALPNLAHAQTRAQCVAQQIESALSGARAFDPAHSNLWKYTFQMELTDNSAVFREDPKARVFMPMIPAMADEVDVIQLGATDPRLLAKFTGPGIVFWPQHPLNTDSRVPYYGKTSTDRIEVKPTASRSMLSFESDVPAFSVKTGTDHPHQKNPEPEKAITQVDVRGALLRQPYVSAVEKILPKDDLLVLLPETLVLRHKETGEGVVIRDLSRIDNENIYITGLSIPYSGRKIAKANGAKFADFWREHYSAALGRAKARLLLDYGLEMETPNSQNILVELDRDFHPTGRIVLRDTVDSSFYGSWLKALGLKNIEKENRRLGYEPIRYLRPYGVNSHFRFDEAGPHGFTPDEIHEMEDAHDEAWLDEIQKQLGFKNEKLTSPGRMDDFLNSGAGRKLMREYHERKGTLGKIQGIDAEVENSPSKIDSGTGSSWYSPFLFWK